MSEVADKRCGRCKEFKSITEFTIHRRTKDGLNYACRKCTRESRRLSRIKNIERERAYYAKNREQFAEGRRRWRANDENRLRENASNLRRYHDNKPQWLEWHRIWSQANREATRHHASRRRARIAAATVIAFTPDQLAQRWAYYDDKCWICREPATATDHVKPLSRGGAHMLCNLRPICKPCNSAKHNRWPVPDLLLGTAFRLSVA